jgi:hypothetical protein
MRLAQAVPRHHGGSPSEGIRLIVVKCMLALEGTEAGKMRVEWWEHVVRDLCGAREQVQGVVNKCRGSGRDKPV